MLILGFDTETTGLNLQSDHIVQFGAVLWDTQAKKKKAKMKIDMLVNSPLITEIDPVASEVNGITLADLELYGEDPAIVFPMIMSLFKEADAICAHNGNLFDKPMLKYNCERYGFKMVDKIWIDTTCDIEYPSHINTRKLSYLATEHGFVNPFPHDAISDVLTMLKVADLYDWDKMLEYAKSPTLTVMAESTFQQKELCKKQNYRWEGETKRWVKSIKDFQLAETEKAGREAGFNVRVLKVPSNG